MELHRWQLGLKNNAVHGVDIWNNSNVGLGTDSAAVVVVADNGRNGVNTQFASNLFVDDAMIETNGGHGIAAGGNSAVYALTSTITGNSENGIDAWSGVDITLDGSSVTGNTGGDISGGGGSRLNGYNGSQVGSVDCDDSVLSYNEVSCPGN